MPSTINADNGAISGSAGVKTTADSSGVLDLQTNGTTRLTIDTSGNMGLAVTPSAWPAGVAAFQFGDSGALWVRNSDNLTVLSANAFFNGTNDKYIESAAASRMYQSAGAFTWQTAASGTAGNNVSFTTAMTLDASGNLLIGKTSNNFSASGRGDIEINGSSSAILGLTVGEAPRGYFFHTGTDARLYNVANGSLEFATNNTERARITSGGDLLVGTTTAAGKITTVSTANSDTVFTWANNASFTAGCAVLTASRAANSAYSFMFLVSGRPNVTDPVGQDIEFNLRGDGNGYADGTWNNNGADYAEYFESATGGALTVGATVVLEGNKVREATASDPASAIMGVVRPKEPSKASMVVGNTAWNKWANKYLTDDFDRYFMEDHDVVEWTDEDGKQHSYESHNIPAGVTVPADAVVKTHDDKGNRFQHYKLNPAWDKDAEYTPREKRDEWIIVGLVGQVKVLKGKPVNDRWIKMRDVSAAVEEWMIR